MKRRNNFALVVLTLATAGLMTASAVAQTRPAGQARVGQRAPGTPEVRQAANNQAGANAAPRPRAAQAPAAPRAPFTLSETQQQLLDQILHKWETHSAKVSTFKCGFQRWEYDKTFGAQHLDFVKSDAEGYIRFRSPDQGRYVVSELKEWDQSKAEGKGAFVPKEDGLDNWLCDGKAIYEFNAKAKQVIVRKLPPELQGKAIVDGPLPFLFGAKAGELTRRYWMRDVTPKEYIGKQVWLEAYPKFQKDQVNFSRATVILNEADFLPYGLQIYLPNGKDNTAYLFKSCKTNGILDVLEFRMPNVPFGWKVVEEEAPSESPGAPSVPPERLTGDKAQAKRTPPGNQRK